MSDDYPHFKDFAQQDKGPLEGEKKKIAEILNKDILILNFQIKKSKIKDGNYATIQFENGTKKYVVFTASGPLMDQLKENKAKMPFHTTIIQKFNYFTFS